MAGGVGVPYPLLLSSSRATTLRDHCTINVLTYWRFNMKDLIAVIVITTALLVLVLEYFDILVR